MFDTTRSTTYIHESSIVFSKTKPTFQPGFKIEWNCSISIYFFYCYSKSIVLFEIVIRLYYKSNYNSCHKMHNQYYFKNETTWESITIWQICSIVKRKKLKKTGWVSICLNGFSFHIFDCQILILNLINLYYILLSVTVYFAFCLNIIYIISLMP